MHDYPQIWRQFYDWILNGGLTPVPQKITNVPKHIVEARRAKNRRARDSRRFNRLRAKGK